MEWGTIMVLSGMRAICDTIALAKSVNPRSPRSACHAARQPPRRQGTKGAAAQRGPPEGQTLASEGDVEMTGAGLWLGVAPPCCGRADRIAACSGRTARSPQANGPGKISSHVALTSAPGALSSSTSDLNRRRSSFMRRRGSAPNRLASR
jgi:hypothetical protein